MHNMNDKSKHVWWYWKHFKVIKETWGKGKRKKETENVMLAVYQYLNEIKHTLSIFTVKHQVWLLLELHTSWMMLRSTENKVEHKFITEYLRNETVFAGLVLNAENCATCSTSYTSFWGSSMCKRLLCTFPKVLLPNSILLHSSFVYLDSKIRNSKEECWNRI